MNRKNWIRVGVVLAVIAAVVVVTQMMKIDRGTVEIEQPIRPVKTMVAETSPSQFDRVFSGRVQASQTVNLSFLTGGDLVELPVREGDLLEQGDLIARLDARNAQSALDSARADLSLAQSELERNQVLFDEELISAAEFDVKRRAFEVAVAAFETASKAVEDTEIRAPFSGFVARRFVENFEKVQASQTIVTFFDPTGIDITIDVPESVVNLIPHYQVQATVAFEQSSGASYDIRIKEFATVADPYTKTYSVTFTLDRPSGVLILPDMTAAVTVQFTREAQDDDEDFLIPSTAIVYDIETDGSIVWVLNESTMTVSPRPVVADRTQAGQVAITEGLSAGEVIVTAGGGFLNAGQEVRKYDE